MIISVKSSFKLILKNKNPPYPQVKIIYNLNTKSKSECESKMENHVLFQNFFHLFLKIYLSFPING